MPLTGYFEPTALTATAINAACVAAKSAGGGTVWLGNGTYTGDVTITFDPTCVSIEGADAIVDYSARTGNFVALAADATNSFNYKCGLAHALRGWILRGNSTAGSVGLYLNTPLGAHDNSTTFNTENFVIERFGVNLDIGANCYICTFRGLSLGWCIENQIRRLTFANNGENMSFFGGKIFNGGGVALNLRGSNQEWRFFGVSFDYNKQVLYTDAPVVEFHGCHFESAWANLSSLLNWQGVFEGDNGATVKFFGGEIGLTSTQITNIDHLFKSWGTGGLNVEFYGTELPNSLHYKLGLCNDMSKIKVATLDKEPIATKAHANIIYLDLTKSTHFKTTLTSDFYLPNPTNYAVGQRFSYWFKQDATGNRKLLMIGDKFFGEPITLSTTPNYEDRLDCFVADLTRIEYTLVKRTNTMIAGSLTPIMLGQIASGGGGFDADAQAFITAASITDSTQQNAINTLVTDLKSAGIFGSGKILAFYPFVGGSASSHKWNLIDPRDLDAAFRLNFFGTWTHSSNGVQGNGGTNNYIDTYFNPSTQRSLNSQSQGIYIRNNSSSANADLGQITTAGGQEINIYSRYTDNNTYFRAGDGSGGNANSDSSGFFIGNRISSTESRNRRRGALVVISASSVAVVSANIILGAAIATNNNTSRQYASAFIGNGLTDAETLALHNAVQAFQTTLGRQV